MDLKKKLMIIFVPLVVLAVISFVIEFICFQGSRDMGCGWFTVMMAFPIALFWIFISVLYIVLYNKFNSNVQREDSKRNGYLWFSIIMIFLTIIMVVIGLEEILFFEVFAYLIGLGVIKLYYGWRDKN